MTQTIVTTTASIKPKCMYKFYEKLFSVTVMRHFLSVEKVFKIDFVSAYDWTA
jgi:hypothetical protein